MAQQEVHVAQTRDPPKEQKAFRFFFSRMRRRAALSGARVCGNDA